VVILDLADQLKRPAHEVGADYFALGGGTGIFSVIRKIEDMRGEDYYDALALKAQRVELAELLRMLVIRLRSVKGDAETKLAALGDGAAVFRELASISGDDFGPAALMVCIDRIRLILRKQGER